MADQDRNRAPQNPATAPTKPRWSAIGSPEADDRREPASPDRHTKTTPPRARQTPASLPPVRYPQIRESRRRPKRYGFFNSLLMGRDPEPGMRWTGRAPIFISPPPCPGSSVGRATDS